jgi:serine protease inhibitor
MVELKKIMVGLSVAAIISVFQCSQMGANPASTTPVSNDRVLGSTPVIASSNDFGFTLFKKVCEDSSSSVFISPLSVSLAFGMVCNGAGGTTYEAIRNTLGFSDLTMQAINESYRHILDRLPGLDPKTEFTMANSIWYRNGYPVKDAFLNVNKSYFDAMVRGLDFSAHWAADTINGWVAANTRDRITQIVDKNIDPLTVMFLINTCYFKGAWTDIFDKSETVSRPFFTEANASIPCAMMKRTGLYNYGETGDFQMIELPYGNGSFSMTVLLPAGTKTIDDIVVSLNSSNFAQWVGAMKRDSVVFSFPRLKFEYSNELSKVLSTLGMKIAFTNGAADFSGINNDPNLHITTVRHKTFVEINEDGTEAAAATSIEMQASICPAPSPHPIKSMDVNHPYLVIIRENATQSILFIGKVTDPTVTKSGE